jgi:hypothetical protein
VKIIRGAGVMLLLLLLVSQGAQAALAIPELDRPAPIAGLWQFSAGGDRVITCHLEVLGWRYAESGLELMTLL